MTTQATAKVRLLVEITLDDCWGDDCTCGQVFYQAKRAAIEAITNLGNPINAADLSRKLRIIGEPEIIQIVRERK